MKGIEEALERIKVSHYTAIAVMGCERDYETEEAIKIVEKALLKTQEPRIIVVDEKGFDGSWEKSEEGKKRLAEIKELLKDKDLGDYTNPSMPPINHIYISKKYLKWEDLPFEDNKMKGISVRMNSSIYLLIFSKYENCENVRLQYTNGKECNEFLYINASDVYAKQFFNDLKLERVEE